MKREMRRMLVLAILFPVLLLASCVRLPSGNVPGPGVSTPPALSVPAAPAPTDWHSGVKTDYSYLTPYAPPTEKYTRLQDGALPALVPSDRYGTLLPYVGETMFSDDGYNTIRKYGLVTAAGMIVTDPVYDRIHQGSYYSYSTYAGTHVAAYSITKLSEEIDADNPWESERQAACALDGSWITPFEYASVSFTDKVIILVRDHGKNDIDVMDYSGTLLYNSKSLECYGDIPDASAYAFASGYGEGFIAVPLKGGRSVLIDALTGSETYINYEQCSAFSEGRAAVMQDGLYGFIDRSYNLVIPPQSVWYDYFHNGKSIIQYPDQSYAIIDADGNVLLKSQNYISRWDNSTYSVYDGSNKTAFYDSNLNILTDGSDSAYPVYNSDWLYKVENNDVIVFRGNERHTFRDIDGVNFIIGELAAVYNNTDTSWQGGIMTLEGNVVIPIADGLSISIYTSKKTGKTYMVGSTYGNNQSYQVYDSDGGLLFSGSGYASYLPQHDLFEVNNELSYAYLDTNGNDVFRLSLMDYVPD